MQLSSSVLKKSTTLELLTLKSLLFELIERISRFYLHIEDIKEKFFQIDEIAYKEYGVQKVQLLEPYRECLSKLFQGAVCISKQISAEDFNDDKIKDLMNVLQSLMGVLKELHIQKLGHLPRPPEPTELKRFGRILDKHCMNLRQKGNENQSEIYIYLDEQISETAYAGDPLGDFKYTVFNESLKEINQAIGDFGVLKEFTDSHRYSGYHVTIPRIDATNPCRWPTLVHELAHKIMDDDFFKNGGIENDFMQMLSDLQVKIPNAISPRIDVRSWLTECWCDLLGTVVMGPTFWFAQATSFIFFYGIKDFGNIDRIHPPPLFRLFLINKVLHHRFNSAIFDELDNSINLTKRLIEFFDEKCEYSFSNNDELKEFALQFKVYFLDHFFKKKDGKFKLGEPSLNDHISFLLKYTEKIEHNDINKLISHFEKGFPAPSIRVESKEGVQERPSTVQELLLAAWVYRNNGFKNKILSMIDNIDTNLSEDSLWDDYCNTIGKVFREFNFSVLRSIQVSEWFDLLEKDNDPADISYITQNIQYNSIGVLCDHEIYSLIKREELLVIPMINFYKQIGSTSLDIRLGTSFQVYYPNQVGIVDLTDANSIDNANKHSDLVDLDFVESITIAPGQFILAHSMEYLQLPKDLSAEVEGRSSFARLGVEVHMTAGFIDPGFQGVLTFEIFNAGPNPIRLYPGLRIGQLRFFHGNPPTKPYNRNPTAKYRGLLTHHKSMQFNDYEVNLLSREINKQKKSR